jgi:hypothetical protein
MKLVGKIIVLLGVLFVSACSTSVKTQVADTKVNDAQLSETQSIPEIVKFEEVDQKTMQKSENTFEVSKVAPKGHKTQKSQLPSKS